MAKVDSEAIELQELPEIKQCPHHHTDDADDDMYYIDLSWSKVRDTDYVLFGIGLALLILCSSFLDAFFITPETVSYFVLFIFAGLIGGRLLQYDDQPDPNSAAAYDGTWAPGGAGGSERAVDSNANDTAQDGGAASDVEVKQQPGQSSMEIL